jgi:hypothetical protein
MKDQGTYFEILWGVCKLVRLVRNRFSFAVLLFLCRCMILLYLWMIEACVYRQNEIITAGNKKQSQSVILYIGR